jgi:STE24 endopeptidase
MKSEQLNWFWKSFKVGFKGRLAVCIALTVSLSIFNSFSYPLVRITAALATFVTAEMFVLCYFPFFWDNFMLMFRSNKAVEVPLPDELVVLSKNMGLKITKMKIFPKICNAYARGSQLYIGQELLEKLNAEQIKAVVGHEFGHIKGRHMIVQACYILPILAVVGLSWSSLPPAMLELGLFAYMMIAMVPIHWWVERRADFAAAKYVGKEPFRSALLTFVEKDKLNVSSETHPPVRLRIRWIEEAEL